MISVIFFYVHILVVGRLLAWQLTNTGNEYGSPGSEEVCLPGVKIPEMSMGAREVRKCVYRV